MKEFEYYILAPREYKRYKQIMKLIDTFFKDKAKSRIWMDTENVLFGGLTPIEVVIMGRGEVILKVVRQCLEENKK